jgi:molybdenum cofactor cytidylyltransferase
MGRPKQQLVYRGETLLQHAIATALASACSPVVVVLGAYADIILPTIPTESVHVVQHSTWQEGMGSSIRVGITALQKIATNVDGTVIMLCDQPFVDATLLNYLIEKKQQTGKLIIASAYASRLKGADTGISGGVPVLFDKSLFPLLARLQGQEGAKMILLQHAASVATIPFPKGNIDIDTDRDFELFID